MNGKWLILLLCVVLAAGCGSARKSKRQKARIVRIISKNPELMDSFTYRVRDTFIRKEYEHDTIFRMNDTGGRDTFYIEHEIFTQTIYRDGNELRSNTTVKADTGILEANVPQFKITKDDLQEIAEDRPIKRAGDFVNKLIGLVLAIGALFLVLILGLIVWRKKSK